ncbi:unnamed protein product, partial [Nesidiocoris tenuis]
MMIVTNLMSIGRESSPIRRKNRRRGFSLSNCRNIFKVANVGKKAKNVDLFTRDGKPEMATMLNQHPAVDRQINFRNFHSESIRCTIFTVSIKCLCCSGTGTGANQVEDKALTIPQQNLRKLQGSSTHTTKVTRKGNKLIIQQERLIKHFCSQIS